MSPLDFSFTFSTVSTPTMRPGSTWFSYWVLGVLLCEGLGQFLWITTGPPAALPALVAAIPRSLVVGVALGAWQSFALMRWLKGGGDWWWPTAVGMTLGAFIGSHLHLGWTVAAWLPGAAVTGFITGLGQWLVLRRTLRRSASWVLISTAAKIAAAAIAALGAVLANGVFANAAPDTRVLIAPGVALLGLVLTDGCLLGAVAGWLLGPGNRRGPKLKFST